MSRKRTNRRRYALVNPIEFAIVGAALTDEATLDKLRFRELAAIEAFRTGKAGKQEWCDLADMLNICETLSRAGVGPEALESCEQAQQALAEAHERHHKEGRALLLRGVELQALRDAYEFHDLQRQSIPRADYERAITKTHDRIRSGDPKVRVCMA
jgi:anthranilate/para-aminobenzoate synthase component I